MIVLYILTGFFILAIGGNVCEILCSLTEWIKAAINVQIARYNATIRELNSEPEETSSQRLIGFVAPCEEEEEEEEYFDD